MSDTNAKAELLADKIERTACMFTIKNADCYSAELRGVRIEIYDFEAKMIVAALRTSASKEPDDDGQ